jgi:RNA polymerase sigma-70 factor (ECF subfamily)
MSDVNLAIAIGRYDQDALSEVYRRHGSAVFGLASRLVRDPALAEDVTQNVFTRFWEQPDRFDPDRGALRSFLLSHAHNRAVDLIRQESARRNREDKVAMGATETGDDIEREVIDLAVAERVRAALALLNEHERAAIELAYFGGCTYQQVGEQLGQPEGTVKGRIRAGLKKMKVSLVDAEIEPG